MRQVTFLGVAASALERAQIECEIPPEAEIWVVNEAHRGLPSGRPPSRVFQLHVRDWREAERRYLNRGELPAGVEAGCFGRNREHVEYLQTCGVPVYCQSGWADIPTCVVYPFERVRQAVGVPLPPFGDRRLWVTSSFGYMAALLLAEHLGGQTVAHLQLIGIELPLGTNRERVWEWPNFAYYLGWARGLGIEILLPRVGTSLLSAPHYALGGHPYPMEADHWWAPGQAGIALEDGTFRLGTMEGQL